MSTEGGVRNSGLPEVLPRRNAQGPPEHSREGAWAFVSWFQGDVDNGFIISKFADRFQKDCLSLPLSESHPCFRDENSVDRAATGPNYVRPLIAAAPSMTGCGAPYGPRRLTAKFFYSAGAGAGAVSPPSRAGSRRAARTMRPAAKANTIIKVSKPPPPTRIPEATSPKKLGSGSRRTE